MQRLLDLFCCEGVGALGYNASGLFQSITGVDMDNMSNRYSFRFVQRNAMTIDYDYLALYDFIHASPPCQGYSKATPKRYKESHARLVAATHTMLYASGLPYVIENVEGAGQELRPNLCLTGEDVGLPMRRRRYFHLSYMPCDERRFKAICAQKFKRIGGEMIAPNGSDYVRKEDLMRAYGLYELPVSHTQKLTRYGLEQGIPPRMTMAISNIMLGVWR